MKLSDLDELIPQYAQNKSEMESYKKICDRENAEIKSIMKSFVVQAYQAGGYKASYSVSKRESMNEEMLLQIAHMHGIPEIVKTKEYIDYDALEHAIYNGQISDEVLMEMDKAKEVKEVVTLRIAKVKNEE